MTSIITALQNEVKGLIDLQKTLLNQINHTEGLWNEGEKSEGTLSPEKIVHNIKVLDGEHDKTSRLESVVAVVGTMKAGKSTTINALVGEEVLPHRELAMTTLPTLIRHKPGQKIPIMTIKNITPIINLGKEISNKFKCISENAIGKRFFNENLLNAVKAGQFEIKDEYQGSDIHTALMDINDIFRLANDESINIDVEDYIVNYDSIDELPTIEVEFSNLSKKSLLDGSGSFALLDTPGPNEAGQGDVLRNRLAEQIKRASMVLCVMDYTKLNCEEDDAIRKQIADMKAVFDKNIFIVVNKFDDNKSGSILDEDKTKDYVSDLIGESLNDGGFNRGCIFPVSSYLAFLSTRMKKQISSSVDLDDLIKNRDPKGWINDFLKEAFGLFDDDQEFCKDVLMSRCNKIIKKSQYENLVENMLMRAYGNSAYISLISALRKVKEFSEEVDIFLGIKVGGFSEKIERLEETIKKLKCLDEGVSKIKKEYNDVLLGFAECYEGEVEQLLSGSIQDLNNELKEMLLAAKSNIEQEIEGEIEKNEVSIKGINKVVGVHINRKNLNKEMYLKDKINDLKKEIEDRKNDGGVISFGDDKKGAISFIENIESVISEKFILVGELIKSKVGDVGDNLRSKLEGEIGNKISSLSDEFKMELESRGYCFKSNIIPKFSIDISCSENTYTRLGEKYVSSEVYGEYGFKEILVFREGFWHGLLKVASLGLREDYGFEYRLERVEEEVFKVNVNDISVVIEESIKKLGNSLKKEVSNQINKELRPKISNAFDVILNRISEIMVDFERTRSAKESDRENIMNVCDALAKKKPENSDILQRTGVAINGLNELHGAISAGAH